MVQFDRFFAVFKIKKEENHNCQFFLVQSSPVCSYFLVTQTRPYYFKKLVKIQIDTKLAHETCAGHISRTTCLIALVFFVSHSPTCTAGPSVFNFYNFFLKPFLTSPASICLKLRQLEARLEYIKKSQQLRTPGPAVHVGECDTKRLGKSSKLFLRYGLHKFFEKHSKALCRYGFITTEV